MKKNVKILGAAAAALLAVAPVVASATTVNASTVTVTPGATTNTPDTPALNLNVQLTATANSTQVSVIKKSVKIVPDNGAQVNGLSNATIEIVPVNSDDTLGDPLTDSQTLDPGTLYRVRVTGVTFSHLLTGRTWNLGNATWNGEPTATSEGLMNGKNNTFVSAPFSLTQAGDTTQPYFSDSTTNQLPAGAVAHTGTNGEGVSTIVDATSGAATTTVNAANILASAKKAVTPHNDGVVTTTATDIANQLAQQNVAVHNGIYTIPTNGFHVTLTAVNRKSGKTVTVVVPFQGSDADYSSYPIITFQGNLATAADGVFNDKFENSNAQGKQTPDASQLVRTVEVGSTFSNENALRPFKATTHDNASSIDMSVLSNPVNTRVPGRYTVTLAATDWSNGRTTRYSYTVQVGEADTTYQTVNYPAEYGVNIWSIAGDTVSFTGNRQPGQSSVPTFGTKTVNGVSYTEIGSKGSNHWIQTQYLGNHSNENKPSNNGETKLNGVGRVSYNGKGAVRLLNANGHYVDQYVKKGSSFKVWAEKTVNGQHLYRIGSQSQWIPAKYFSLN